MVIPRLLKKYEHFATIGGVDGGKWFTETVQEMESEDLMCDLLRDHEIDLKWRPPASAGRPSEVSICVAYSFESTAVDATHFGLNLDLNLAEPN
jgi:hypothetical protein